MITSQPGSLTFCRMINLFNVGDTGKDKLRLSFPESGIADIDHVSGRGVRVFDHGDSCQVMYYDGQDDEFGTWATVKDHCNAVGAVMAYLEDYIEFHKEEY